MMRKLLFSFFILLVSIAVAGAENSICDLIYQENNSCAYFYSETYALNGWDSAIPNVAGVVTTQTLDNSILYQITKPGDGIYLKKLTVEGTSYELETYTRDSYGNCVLWWDRHFGAHFDMMYNGQKVGDAYYYGRWEGFDIYFVWNETAYDLVPAGAAISAVFVNKWLYWDNGGCAIGDAIRLPHANNDGDGHSFDFSKTFLNDKIYVYVTEHVTALRIPKSLNYIRADEVYVTYYQKNRIDIEYCADGTQYYMQVNPQSAIYAYFRAKDDNSVLKTINGWTMDNYADNEAFYLEVYPNGFNTSTVFTYDFNDEIADCELLPITSASATLKVKSASGIFIKSYKLVINGTELVVDNYEADISDYYGKGVSVTIIPLFDSRLSETHSLTVQGGQNVIQLNNYYYSVQLRAYYKDPLGNLRPIGFSWLIQGVMKPDKVNYAGNFSMGGTGFSNFTVLVPAGEYTVTFKANIFGFDKTDSQALTLLDDNYYKYVTFIVSLTSTEIQNGSSTSAILQVIVNDQYGKEVNNATVKVYDGNNTLIANQFTHDGQAIVGGLQIGSSYKIEVWVGQTKKAEKSITITEASQTVIITINLNEQEEEYLSGGGDTTFGGGTGGTGEDTHTVAQNIVLSIFRSYGFWGLVILISITVLAAANGGERIGLLTFVAGLGVLTFVIPLLPQVIFVVVAIIAFLFFGWQAVDRIVAGRG